MIDVNRLCAGCMREKKIAVDVCPYCGFSLSDYQQNARCLAINTILAGKYLVGKVLGQGGFGITYMGLDLNMETRVAIKEYFPVELVSRDTTSMTGDRVLSLSGDKRQTYQQGLEKYVKEAQNVSQFTDIPGVVSVKDFFYENETAYIVMEYIDGMSLKDYLAKCGGRLSEAEALVIVKPVLEALVKVHKAGMIHRDISPDNIMLTFEEGKVSSVKLIDFGAARMTVKSDQKSLTIILKHGYAPEEQYRTHGEQGPWTDVYAICAVLYRMLTGETPVSAMDRLFEDGLKGFSDYSVKVRKSTADAVMRGLAVKKEDRFSSVSELIGALYEGKAVKKTKTHKTALIAGVAAAGVAVAAGIFVVVGGMTTKSSSSTQLVQEAADGQAAMAEDLQSEEVPDSSSQDVTGAEMVALEEKPDEEEDFGEVIVTAHPQTSYAISDNHAVILQEDGTVISAGSNQYGQRNLSEWTRIAAVAAGDTFSAGLRENGTVVVAGSLDGSEDVERWTDIVEIVASVDYLYGLTSEGTVVANHLSTDLRECLEWSDICAIAASHNVFCALTRDGRVRSVGLKQTASEISGWDDVEYLVMDRNIAVGLRANGTLIQAELWTEPLTSSTLLNELEEFRNIKQISMATGTCFGVSEDGTMHIALADSRRVNSYDVDPLSWDELTGVLVNYSANHLVGIRADGMIEVAFSNMGNAAVKDMKDLVQVKIYNDDYSDGIAVIGLTKGKELLYQTSDGGSLYKKFADKAQDVSGLENLWEMRYHFKDNAVSIGICYLDLAGNLYMEDYLNNGPRGGLIRVNDIPLTQISVVPGSSTSRTSYAVGVSADGRVHIYSRSVREPSEALYEAENWTDISQVACYMSRKAGKSDVSGILGLKTDGTTLNICSNDTVEELAENWENIETLYAGDYAVGAIRSDGTAVFLEDAPEYNYGQYNTYDWTDLTQLALGMFHTAGLRSDGTVCAVGRNDAGQCDVGDWTDIVYIAAGDSCTLGIKSDGSLVIAGDISW